MGRGLIEAVAAAARDRGCNRLYWTTKEDNATARSLYDRIARFNGFIRIVTIATWGYFPGFAAVAALTSGLIP